MRAALVAAVIMLASCAPSPAPRTESGFMPPDMCAAIGWPGAVLGGLALIVFGIVALYWIDSHYRSRAK